MDSENPYRAPGYSQKDEEEEKPGSSAQQCPHCLIDVTFWAALKMPTPFLFKCSGCESTFRVESPFMRLIVTIAVVGAGAQLAGVFFCVERFGAISLAATLPVLIGSYCGLEVWLYRYIMRHGRFIALDADDEGSPPF